MSHVSLRILTHAQARAVRHGPGLEILALSNFGVAIDIRHCSGKARAVEAIDPAPRDRPLCFRRGGIRFRALMLPPVSSRLESL